MAKQSKEDRLRVNEEANRLYDKYNPKPHEKISVPKDQCIREARQRLGLDK